MEIPPRTGRDGMAIDEDLEDTAPSAGVPALQDAVEQR